MEEEDIATPPRTPSKWRCLKQLVSFRSIACCGSLWSNHPHPMSLPQEEPDYSMYSQDEQNSQQQEEEEISPDLQCLILHHQNSRETNLASALAAERQLRAATSANSATPPIARPSETMSLMSLLEEKEKEEKKAKIGSCENEDEEEGMGNGCYCCVCMGRRKGAAFIPCGHTFCRMCARELWINRGSCPLCNRTIVEILDIF